MGKRKDMGPGLSFCDIETKYPGIHVQIVSAGKERNSKQNLAHRDLKGIPAYSPVTVTGILEESQRNTPSPLYEHSKKWDLRLYSIQCLNSFPKDIVVSKDAVWPPKSRHLQLRFDPLLRERLKFRDEIRRLLEKRLAQKQFFQYETPVLFKSTPEGAREFLVPTRRRGYAYALPQSPQQYKQILMAGGVMRYFQFAKCFRDEDHRADRQPEFTQLDLEMAFATGKDVAKVVETLVEAVHEFIHTNYTPIEINGTRHPVRIHNQGDTDTKHKPQLSDRYPSVGFSDSITYKDAMARFGTDKPDLRIRAPHASNVGSANW